MQINYSIGNEYRYAGSRQRFKLVEVRNEIIFCFECGHWCTDNVFIDLIDCKTGKQVGENTQLELF